MNASKVAQKALSASESATIRRLINRTIIVEWGTIKEINEDGGVVEVLLSVTDRPENATVVTCILISPCSKGFALDIKPSVGDKVLVLSPRFYDVDMFDVTEDTEVIVEDNSYGYNKLTCLAILYNQYREDTHKNYISIDEGKVTMALGYNEDDEKNMLNFTSDADGAFSVSNPNCSITVDKDGYLSYETTSDSDDKTKLEFTSSGMTMQDKNGCKIVSSSSDIQINGKLKINKGA